MPTRWTKQSYESCIPLPLALVRNTASWKSVLNRARIYAIDPHVEYVGPKGGVYGPRDQAALYRNIVRNRVGELVAVVSLTSKLPPRRGLINQSDSSGSTATTGMRACVVI